MANSLSVSIVFADDPIDAVIDTLLQCNAQTFSGHLMTRNADQLPGIPAIKAVRETGMAHAAAAAAQVEQRQLGRFQKNSLERRFIRSRVRAGQTRDNAREEFESLTADELTYACQSVATSKGLVAPAAFGDGKFLETFLAFITDHWDDILRILLMLLGLPPI
jgi:hypothetical protein